MFVHINHSIYGMECGSGGIGGEAYDFKECGWKPTVGTVFSERHIYRFIYPFIDFRKRKLVLPPHVSQATQRWRIQKYFTLQQREYERQHTRILPWFSSAFEITRFILSITPIVAEIHIMPNAFRAEMRAILLRLFSAAAANMWHCAEVYIRLACVTYTTKSAFIPIKLRTFLELNIHVRERPNDIFNAGAWAESA